MSKLSVNNMLIFAVVIGVIFGVVAAFVQREPSKISSATTENGSITDLDAGHILDMHGEEALIESGLGGFEALHGGFSSTPDFLRSRLESRGISVPEGATTEELQNLLADAGISMEQLHQ